ncbi:(2Fe-2S) ferredoxin domain-containing protein [Thermosediminibacter litoriperuensis]|uniref:Thioredoxin-like protein n=1 Tax=Thermosediminibacter litoriperuensis TaxID=291989 RepID=A0A5S5AVI5_9FIRM|nr:(2Fe-2S) ferredoxin domain-containing protein [Thermosediminibacter litoriperuensis]TYP55430.1 thioredoxin-like protein [Thermosediminibacter litoriperuensis]
MIEITVCVGSSCHLKGAYEVIKEFERQIPLYGLENVVELKAGFCLGRCAEAVTVKIGGKYFTSVASKDVAGLLEVVKNGGVKED